jgi:2-polyprenyl-6-methoxyphenol hydroxylase-like FAD-dependent oxidoreductase
MPCFPVAIVGGGPVGLTLSLELSRLGVQHVLVTENEQTSAHPKCNTTNARSMEHFRRLGVANRLRFGGLKPDYPTDIAYFTRLAGEEIARIRFPSAREAAAGAGAPEGLTPEPQHRISQIFLEQILLDAAQGHPEADLRFGARVVGIQQSEDQVTLEIADGPDIQARWLVACDGGSSSVRRFLGLKLQGPPPARRAMFGGPMLAVFYRSAALGRMLAPRQSFMYWTLNAEVRSVTVAIDGDERFLTHVQAPDGLSPKDLDPLVYLPCAVGQTIDIEVLSSAEWNAGYELVADRFRAGRAFLAGDAAHLLTPTGGFGMNTGIDDVANLAWKLAAVEAGWGGPALLASYDEERRPIALRNARAASEIADLIANVDIPLDIEAADASGAEARAQVRAKVAGVAVEEFMTTGVQLGARYDTSSVIVDDGSQAPAPSRTVYVPTAKPGSRAPHLYLEDGSSLYDRFGAGFTLLVLDSIGAEPFVQAAAARGLPLKVVRLPARRARDCYQANLVLVRPDQHVAWRGDAAPPDVAGLLDRVRGEA